jgi:hypothetical protein
MVETIIRTVKAYQTGKPDSKVVTIPKEIREKLGEANTDLFIVKLDEKGRIIYEPIKKEP